MSLMHKRVGSADVEALRYVIEDCKLDVHEQDEVSFFFILYIFINHNLPDWS